MEKILLKDILKEAKIRQMISNGIIIIWRLFVPEIGNELIMPLQKISKFQKNGMLTRKTIHYLLHEFEEYVCPGGFLKFFNRKPLGSNRDDLPLTTMGSLWINIPLVFIAFPLSAILADKVDIAIGIWCAYFSVINAVAHVAWLLVYKKYNPGSSRKYITEYSDRDLYGLLLCRQQYNLYENSNHRACLCACSSGDNDDVWLPVFKASD